MVYGGSIASITNFSNCQSVMNLANAHGHLFAADLSKICNNAGGMDNKRDGLFIATAIRRISSVLTRHHHRSPKKVESLIALLQIEAMIASTKLPYINKTAAISNCTQWQWPSFFYKLINF